MTVSAEGFLLGNLFFDAGILLLSSRMCGHRCGWRSLAGGLLGAVYAFLSFLPRGGFLQNLLPRGLVCLGMVAATYIGFPFPKGRRFFSHVGTTFLCTILLGGTGTGLLFAMGQRGWGFLPSVLTAGIGTVCIAALTVRRNRAVSGKGVEVTLIDGEKCVTFSACADTGNVLKEPLSNLPVIVVRKEALCGLDEEKGGRIVPYVTVSGKGTLSAFTVERVLINGREAEAMVAALDGDLGLEGMGLVPGVLVEQI